VVLAEQFRSFLGGSGRRKWTDGSAVGARDRDGDNAGATIAQSHSSHVPARDRDGDASPTGTRKGGPPGSTPVDAPLDWAPESLPRRGALRFCFQKSRHAFWRDEHLISEKYINFEIGSREGDQSKKGAFLASTIAHPLSHSPPGIEPARMDRGGDRGPPGGTAAATLTTVYVAAKPGHLPTWLQLRHCRQSPLATCHARHAGRRGQRTRFRRPGTPCNVLRSSVARPAIPGSEMYGAVPPPSHTEM
jgi:hypothetical protein